MDNYHHDVSKKEILKLRELQKQLPSFLREFFTGIAQRTATKTSMAYAYDLCVFFRYIYEEHRVLGGVESENLEVSDLDKISVVDIEAFLEYLGYYIKTDTENPENALEFSNNSRGKSRKLASVRAMYKYFFKREKIKTNPPSLVDLPKTNSKAIIRLDVNEVGDLLDAVETGEKLTKTQKARHKKMQKRDLAIMTLFLGTGMRISEVVGINIEHLNFNENSVLITRKGGDTALIYFGDEVLEALLNYMEERKEIITEEENTALFLSNQCRRISLRQVQILVKKYSESVTAKKITPHKLRSTFGTNLYNETKDINIVANVLGHKTIETTQKHYVDTEEQLKRNVVKHTKLRKD